MAVYILKESKLFSLPIIALWTYVFYKVMCTAFGNPYGPVWLALFFFIGLYDLCSPRLFVDHNCIFYSRRIWIFLDKKIPKEDIVSIHLLHVPRSGQALQFVCASGKKINVSGNIEKAARVTELLGIDLSDKIES